MKQRLKSWVMDLSLRLKEWNDRWYFWLNPLVEVEGDEPYLPDRWYDPGFHFIRDRLDNLWEWAYDGSDFEIEMVETGAMPIVYFSERQLAYLDLPRDQYDARCGKCHWKGLWSEGVGEDCVICPQCDGEIYLEPFEYSYAATLNPSEIYNPPSPESPC